MSTFTIKAGDYHRQLGLDLSEITTTGASSVVIRMRPRDGGTVVNPTGVIASASRINVTFTGTQLDTPGVYLLEAALQYGDGPETVPTAGYVTVLVVAKLG
jgi:hypothetical protein